MTTLKKFLTFIVCVASTLSLTAQLSLDLSDISGSKGELVDVEVRVNGFQDIASMQFSVNWDSTVLAFKSIDNLTDLLPSFSENEIGILEVSSGSFRVAWFDSSVQGISVADSTQLFTVQYEIIGDPGANSNILISGSPIPIEFTTKDGNLVELGETTGGNITIPGNSTSLGYVIAPNGMALHQNEPNPFSSITRIKAVFPTVEEINFFVSDISGKVVYQNTFTSVQGENTIDISRNIFNTSGTYYYTVQSERYHLSRKMILLPY